MRRAVLANLMIWAALAAAVLAIWLAWIWMNHAPVTGIPEATRPSSHIIHRADPPPAPAGEYRGHAEAPDWLSDPDPGA
jgi:hypothetical protein